MNNSILLLGAGGFIGRRLTSHLQSIGSRVIAMGHALPDHNSTTITTIHGSVADTVLVHKLLLESSTVVYLASVTTPAASAREPGLEVTGNLLPLVRFLEVALEFPSRKLIFISSAGAVYGDGANDAVEAAVLRPRSFYGAGKVAAEAMLHAFALSSGWTTIVIRPTNVYGPGQLPIRGFAVIPTIFQHMLETRTFEIWGDGSVVRDYLYVDDLAQLLGQVIQSSTTNGFSVYNAAAGCAVSVRELVQLCEQASGLPLEINFRPARVIDVPRVVPNTDAVKEVYAWQAATSLTIGLDLTWCWLSQQFHMQK